MKQVVFNPTTHEKLLEGTKLLSEAVGSTLGPKGRNVIIETPYGAVTVTKDGVTVAMQINVDDPIQNMGIDIVKQAATRTAKNAGDGTTTATILAHALAENGVKLFTTYSPIEVKRAYEVLLHDTKKHITHYSTPVTKENILDIATISANNDPVLGKLIYDAFQHASASGLINIEESKTGSTYIQEVEGAHIDQGFISPYFATDFSRGTAVLDNAYVLVTDQKINNPMDIVSILEQVAEKQKPLLIISDEVNGPTIATILKNKLRGAISVAMIKAPAFGERRTEVLTDICALTSANLISETKGMRLSEVTIADLGFVEKITMDQNSTVFVNPKANQTLVDDRAELISSKLQVELTDYDREKLTERLARLKGKVASIFVGAATETELKEVKARVDDAIRATKSALEKGYVEGGGYTFYKIAKELRDNSNIPHDIVEAYVTALISPLKKIITNAGENPAKVIKEMEFRNLGFDARNNEFVDLKKAGIIDPSLVAEEAIENAVSAANMILLSAVAVYRTDRKAPYDPGMSYEN